MYDTNKLNQINLCKIFCRITDQRQFKLSGRIKVKVTGSNTVFTETRVYMCN